MTAALAAPPAPVGVPADVVAAMCAHALAAYPAECCGYLVGAAPDRADAAIACHNALADPALALALRAAPALADRDADTGFAIDGAELLAFARAFAGPRPPRVVYHSHTHGRAYLSALDRALADGPSYPVQHLVIGVAGGAPGGAAITELAQYAWSTPAAAFVEVARWTPGPR